MKATAAVALAAHAVANSWNTSPVMADSNTWYDKIKEIRRFTSNQQQRCYNYPCKRQTECRDTNHSIPYQTWRLRIHLAFNQPKEKSNMSRMRQHNHTFQESECLGRGRRTDTMTTYKVWNRIQCQESFDIYPSKVLPHEVFNDGWVRRLDQVEEDDLRLYETLELEVEQ